MILNLGTLALRPYVNAKRKAKQEEIREYEQKYLARYKQPKSGVKKSSNLKHDTDLGTLTLRPIRQRKAQSKTGGDKKIRAKVSRTLQTTKIRSKEII